MNDMGCEERVVYPVDIDSTLKQRCHTEPLIGPTKHLLHSLSAPDDDFEEAGYYNQHIAYQAGEIEVCCLYFKGLWHLALLRPDAGDFPLASSTHVTCSEGRPDQD